MVNLVTSRHIRRTIRWHRKRQVRCRRRLIWNNLRAIGLSNSVQSRSRSIKWLRYSLSLWDISHIKCHTSTQHRDVSCTDWLTTHRDHSLITINCWYVQIERRISSIRIFIQCRCVCITSRCALLESQAIKLSLSGSINIIVTILKDVVDLQILWHCW